jgi:hypothetical protein
VTGFSNRKIPIELKLFPGKKQSKGRKVEWIDSIDRIFQLKLIGPFFVLGRLRLHNDKLGVSDIDLLSLPTNCAIM